MRKRQRQVNRYVRAVGSYLPCAGKHKKQLLTALRSEAEAYCAETRDADLEARLGRLLPYVRFSMPRKSATA